MITRPVPVLLLLLASGITAAGQKAPDPVFPAVKLSQGARGAGIIAALGNKLPAVARFYGMTDQEFGALCLRDHDLRIDTTGRLLFVFAKAPPRPRLRRHRTPAATRCSIIPPVRLFSCTASRV
jgi:hypothetical protein